MARQDSCVCKADYCLTDLTITAAVEACLTEAPDDGLCPAYGLVTKKYGLMPDWNLKKVTNFENIFASEGNFRRRHIKVGYVCRGKHEIGFCVGFIFQSRD